MLLYTLAQSIVKELTNFQTIEKRKIVSSLGWFRRWLCIPRLHSTTKTLSHSLIVFMCVELWAVISYYDANTKVRRINLPIGEIGLIRGTRGGLRVRLLQHGIYSLVMWKVLHRPRYILLRFIRILINACLYFVSAKAVGLVLLLKGYIFSCKHSCKFTVSKGDFKKKINFKVHSSSPSSSM